MGGAVLQGGTVLRSQIAKRQPRDMGSMTMWRFSCQALVLS